MKLASLQLAVAAWNALPGRIPFELLSIYSGQHYDGRLAGQYIQEYAVDLTIDMTRHHDSTDPDHILGSMLWRLGHALRTLYPLDAVIIFGDANTTLAAAIATKRLNLPLVHVEAGVRTGGTAPEELNRLVADCVADLHLASSRRDMENLDREGHAPSSVFIGDLVRDLVTPMAAGPPAERDGVVVTMHRAENTDNHELLERIFRACVKKGLRIRFFSHPRVLPLARRASRGMAKHVCISESVRHTELLDVIRHSRFIVTDSGALQREAFYVGTRAVVVQDHPFWPGLVESGFHRQSGGSQAEIETAIDRILDTELDPLPIYTDFGVPPVGIRLLRVLSDWIVHR